MPEKQQPAPWRNRITRYAEVAPATLIPREKNFRRHPKGQHAALKGVLAEVGVVQNVIISERSGKILDGHLRVELALGEKQPTVPCTYVDVSEKEEALILATLDPLSAMAVSDDDLLATLVGGIEVSDLAVKDLLAELAGTIVKPVEGEDDVPEAPIAPVSRRGDLWLMGEHRLLCGDSTCAEDVRRVMDDKRATLVFTDPPYGVGYDGGTTVRQKLQGDETTELYGPTCAMAARHSEPTAALYLWHAGIKGIAAAAAAAAAGYEIRCEIVWNKNLAQFGALSSQYKQKHEPCYYCFKRGKVVQWFGPTNEVTVWDCDRANSNTFHPTQKPVDLARRAILNSSALEGIVLDLFLGSGSTLIAAELTGRRCFGLEIEPAYADVIVTRWEKLTGKQATLEGLGATFAHVRDGRRLEAQDALKEEALEAAAR